MSSNSKDQDAKQAGKNGMPLSPGGKKHPNPHGRHHGRQGSRAGGKR